MSTRVDEVRELLALMKTNRVSAMKVGDIELVMDLEPPIAPPTGLPPGGEMPIRPESQTAYQDPGLFAHLGMDAVPTLVGGDS